MDSNPVCLIRQCRKPITGSIRSGLSVVGETFIALAPVRRRVGVRALVGL
jgi:hypothetical protein